MALVLIGKTCCLVCGQPIMDLADVGVFPSFIENERDPLFIFNDSVSHRRCLASHPLAGRVADRFREFEAAKAVWPPVCCVCQKTIAKPDDFFATGRITGNARHNLYPYNYSYMHKHCICSWAVSADVLRFMQTERDSGRSRGRAIDYAISTICKAIRR